MMKSIEYQNKEIQQPKKKTGYGKRTIKMETLLVTYMQRSQQKISRKLIRKES